MDRRQLLQLLGLSGLIGGVGLVGCGPPRPPLAHLHGDAWVSGAYEHYGAAYQALQRDAEEKSQGAYAMLAQRGISALDGLQQREVPFYVRIDEGGTALSVSRQVPERLTFTAGMSDEERAQATAAWEKAREHIHTDYAEIKRLDWALTALLAQVQRLRHAIDQAIVEQYRLTRQRAEVDRGELPFELPSGVTAAAYGEVLVLLVERLEDDRGRLEMMETQLLTIALVARSADEGSASLSQNLRLVLLAVQEDSAAAELRPNDNPTGALREERLAKGREIVARVGASPDYAAWLEREESAWIEQLGSFLQIVDQATGIPISAAYGQAVTVLRGDADYLDYLELVAAFSPSPELGKAIRKGIGLSKQVREVVHTVGEVGERLRKSPEEALRGQLGALVNVGTARARAQLDKQLSFFETPDELRAVTEELDATGLMKRALPRL
ncbi:MAG: hypothetical protein KC731_09465 [Myxococcales bacterium]|nr:hypothetical protein [Myxococcales bacterium]